MSETNKTRNLSKLLFSLIVVGFLIAILVFLSIDLYQPFRLFIETDNIVPLQEQINKYGFWRYFFIVIIHAFQVLLTIIPPTHSNCCRTNLWSLLGFVSCLGGIFIGNTIVYFLVRIFKTNPTLLYNSKQMEKLSSIPEKKPRRILSFYLSLVLCTSNSLQ